ncbi:polysaccharide lyase family protein [Planctomycetota bacterium]
MKHVVLIRTVFLMLLPFGFLAGPAIGQNTTLWQIGKADNHTAEFALGPNRSNQYSSGFPHDAMFVAGHSDPKKDWPYIQPGPADAWAGSKSHTFTILFGIRTAPAAGQAELILDFVDTHSALPPRMEIKINETPFTGKLPRGAGDASAHGEPEKGREHRLVIPFPAKTLKAGNNHITITSLAGSWVLYDYVALSVPSGVETGPVKPTTKLLNVHTQPFLVKRNDGKLYQPVQASVLHIGEPVEAAVTIDGSESVVQSLDPGFKVIEGLAPAVDVPTLVEVEVKVAGKSMGRRKLTIEPVRKWEVWLLHHSHVDIGYTHVQTEVEQKHWQYFQQVIDLARKSADFPNGAPFKWNVEVLWAVDSYLKQASPAEREAFIHAVKKGWIGLDALYGNELTALCRPEELIRLVEYAQMLRNRYEVTIDSAMITDVPGHTWGIVPVLAQSGVKYFSVGPNRGHRIGYTLSTWGDKPFYWESPCGKHKILCWVAGEGYSFFHSGRLDGGRLFDYLSRLEDSEYPYDMLQLRYSIGGDNGPPDPDLSQFVKDWNAKYAYPKIIVATTSEMFREFERRYGDKLSRIRGDFTPYWEDGAGSSARETAMNREAAERLTQAETLWAMLDPGNYPTEQFYEAWRNVILYDEHTWGAHCSISQPDSEFTKAQWKIKQAFALNAEVQSYNLLNNALAKRRATEKNVSAVDVFNTSSWRRTDLVIVPKSITVPRGIIKDADGRIVNSQRLSTGELAFLAEDVAPFSAKRFTFHPGKASASGETTAKGTRLSNDAITLTVNNRTGAIESLNWKELNTELVNRKNDLGLNDYFYVAGREPKDPKRNGAVKISTKERGPLVASLLIESDAPGCNKLTRELRLIDGIDRVDIINIIDKEKIYNQEGVHLAYDFNVPEGMVRMETPWAVVQPETDQLPGACKNYFTVQRWIDISNADHGVTLATPDAPLVEIGAITNDPRGKSVGWIKQLKPSSTLYSYVMNNYWETNYKAGQEGPTTFRYSITPHKAFDPGAAARFGIERSRPLVVVPVDGKMPVRPSTLSVKPNSIIVTAFKPSADGKAKIVRLFNASAQTENVNPTWAKPESVTMWRSNLAEEKGPRLVGAIEMSPYEIVTLRISAAGE